MYKFVYAFIIFPFILFQTFSCNPPSEKTEIFNVSKKVELLCLFKKDSPYEQRKYFHENVLMEKTENGYWTRDGVQAVFNIDVEGYEGEGIKFTSEATIEQKEDIKKRMMESPIVYKVYENIVPSEIKDL